jgi:hypothetical protein
MPSGVEASAPYVRMTLGLSRWALRGRDSLSHGNRPCILWSYGRYSSERVLPFNMLWPLAWAFLTGWASADKLLTASGVSAMGEPLDDWLRIGGRYGMPFPAAAKQSLRRERNMRHIRTITKTSPKSANVLQDLICEALLIMASVFSMKNISIPILGIFTNEDGGFCQPMPISGP